MLLRVRVEPRFARVLLPAQFAHVRLLARVNAHMHAHIVFDGKGLSAHGTRKGPLARVRAQVVFERVQLLELLRALRTAEWTFARVHSQMLLQVRFAPELFAAPRTLRRVGIVNARMSLQIRFVPKLASANVAAKHALCVLNRLVLWRFMSRFLYGFLYGS